MVKMLTLFGKDISKMRYNELKRERHVQSFLLTRMRYISKACSKRCEKKYHNSAYYNTVREDKDLFFKMYVEHLESLIEEIDYWMSRRAEPESNSNRYRTKESIRGENAKRKQLWKSDRNVGNYYAKTAENDIYVSWDRERFNLIAADRGYQTDEIILSAIAEELRLDRTRARLLIDSGRFSWGQVLCLGAMFQMTPKEFCDTFLSGYFVERFGEYRAEYDNLDKAALLKRAVKSQPIPQEPIPQEPMPQEPMPKEQELDLDAFEEVYVDSDGRPIDEDTVWFDD